MGRRSVRHHGEGGRPDHRQPHRIDRLQPVGGRPDRPPRDGRHRHHPDRAAHADATGPIVIPASTGRARLDVGGPTPGDGIYVTFDGQSGFPLDPGQSVTIGRAERPLRLVRAPARSYFEVLRQKLKWNER